MNKIQSLVTAYIETSGDSSKQLRLLHTRGARITKSPSSVSVLSNGLSYYYVEVTGKNGSQFGIPAYGDEAIELHNETLRMEELGAMIS